MVGSGIVFKAVRVREDGKGHTGSFSLLTQKSLHLACFLTQRAASTGDLFQPAPVPVPGEQHQPGRDKKGQAYESKQPPFAPPSEQHERRAIEGQDGGSNDGERSGNCGRHRQRTGRRRRAITISAPFGTSPLEATVWDSSESSAPRYFRTYWDGSPLTRVRASAWRLISPTAVSG